MTSEELQQMRDEHRQRQVLKMVRTMEDKLDKCKIRQKNLEGDCLIIATTVVYLSAFSFKERMDFRRELAEKMLAAGLEASEYWLSDSEAVHCKLFKKIISRDFGMKSSFNKLSHLFIGSNFAELLFTLAVAPTTPVVYDTVGHFQDYLIEEILSEAEGKAKMLFSADYMISEKIEVAMNSELDNQIYLLNDLNDCSKQSMGKSQDSAILNRLARAEVKRVKGLLPIDLPRISLFSPS